MSEKKRRSKLELKFEEILKEYDTDYGYEITKIPYNDAISYLVSCLGS